MRIFTPFILLVLSFASIADDNSKNQSNPVDFKKILQYAELSNVAYSDETTIVKKLNELGLSLTSYQKISGEEVIFFLVTNDKTHEQIIVSRGTANLENVMVDMAFNLIPDKHLGIPLHQGFSSSAVKIFQMIKPLLNKKYKINTTGHSLGGAVALILAMYLEANNYQTGSIITFGQPKVSNIDGSKKFNNLDVTRVVNIKDVVPLVPPVDVSDINNIKIYWHQGKEIILLEKNQFAILTDLKAMLRATGFINQQPSQENLQHHKMELYLTAIKQKTENAEQVSLESIINPFNLFGFSKQ